MRPDAEEADDRRVIRIEADIPGEDPLVADYVRANPIFCAYLVFSWSWIGISLIAILLAGVLGSQLIPMPELPAPPGTPAWFPAWLPDAVADPFAACLRWLVGMNDLGIADWTFNRPILRDIHIYTGRGTAFVLGIGAGTLGMMTLGRLVKPGGIPAVQEAVLSGLLVLALYIGYTDRPVFFSLLTFAVCALYFLAMAFRLKSLLWARHVSLWWLLLTGYAITIGLAWWTAREGDLQRVVTGLTGLEGGLQTTVVVLLVGLPVSHLVCIVIRLFLPRRRSLAPPSPDPDPWPIYTLLVPLYHEVEVADTLIKRLEALDYPHDRLDVKLLLEADDPETLSALERAWIPAWAEAVVVPDAQPKTKPRACNYGLARARGEYLVIYDAEDRPEPDQLKVAVRRFRRLSERVVCLQAQLAYHNHDQNLLTRWFALGYNVWFQRYLDGLTAMGGPIPLGGTSNHFKTGTLRELGGWDPFNVTEDCDLGVRIHATGHRTETIASITWEEANSHIGNWLRQRSRWMKGYLITHLVWCRRPLWLLWRLGPRGTLRFFYSVFGAVGLALLNLPIWLLLGFYVFCLGIDLSRGYPLRDLLVSEVSHMHLDPDRWSWPMIYFGADLSPTWCWLSIVFFGASLVLLLANLLFILVNLVFGRRAGQHGLVVPALLSPLYWVLITLGAWKGFLQLLTRPHYWEKTLHGLDAEHGDDED